MKKSLFILFNVLVLSLSALVGCVGSPDESSEDEAESVAEVEQALPMNPAFTACAKRCWNRYKTCDTGCGLDAACDAACYDDFEVCHDVCVFYFGS